MRLPSWRRATGRRRDVCAGQPAGNPFDAQEHIQPVLDAVKAAEASSDGFTIDSGGGASINEQMNTTIEQDLAFALVMNLSVTLVILLLVFRAPVAAFIPLALALAAVSTATAMLDIISQIRPLSSFH